MEVMGVDAGFTPAFNHKDNFLFELERGRKGPVAQLRSRSEHHNSSHARERVVQNAHGIESRRDGTARFLPCPVPTGLVRLFSIDHGLKPVAKIMPPLRG